MLFTQREFDTMVEELLYTDPARFDMLYHIAEKALRPSVVYWCKTDKTLHGRGYEDDIMQDIHIRLIQTTVDRFLLKDGVDGPVNNDPAGFNAWIRTVAENIKKDSSNKIRGVDFRTVDMDNPLVICAASDNTDDEAERIEELKQAFSVVLDSDARVYKVLTWVAQFVIIIDFDVTKIESNDLLIKLFENSTLYEMYNSILVISRRIPWITVSRVQHERILVELHRIYKDGISYGNTKYKEFFMKQNGIVSGKKSISDWVNRMNNKIVDETSEKPAKKITIANQKNKHKLTPKRRSSNGTSET